MLGWGGVAVEVTHLSPATAGVAYLAGLLSFLSPCVLPLLPVYLALVSGVGVERLGRERSRMVVPALLFVAGFAVVFVLLGAGAGALGGLLLRHRRELTVAAGLLVVLGGLAVAGVLHLPAGLQRVVPSPRRGGAFVTGAAMAVAWTPCVGYVLGAILGLAASGQGAAAGAVLLAVYAAGMGTPFVLAAVAFERVAGGLAWVRRHYRAVQVVAGAVLVACGVLLAAGLLDRLARLLPAVAPGGL